LLHGAAIILDPVSTPPTVFDPSDPRIIGEMIALALLRQERQPLEGLSKFYGSGIYALYYTGSFPAYRPVARKDTPLYVGKADPKVPSAATAKEQGMTLCNRLYAHLKSIGHARNLAVKDFDCRWVVVKSAWQGTAETYLIDRFRPVWNNEVGICFGFGKHGDDPKTRSNTRSPWDTLHPGRPWAMSDGNVPNPRGEEEIQRDILKHFRQHPPEN